MVRAIVGANWGDEGKGKLTDMLAKEPTLIPVFREEATQVIRLSIIMAVSHFTFCRPVYFTDTQPASSAMVWH